MINEVDCFGITNVGMVRQENEDNFFLGHFECGLKINHAGKGFDSNKSFGGSRHGLLMAVADGMGGHAAGEYASELVLKTVCDYLLRELNFFAYRDNAHQVFGNTLRRSVAVAHQALKDDVMANPNRSSMGSTLTMVLVLWPKAYIVHIGDSRCYLLRQQEFNLLTRDHTVGRLRSDLKAGRATAEQAARFENVNWTDIKADDALWNVIAANAEVVTPEIIELDLQGGDSLLLCTDGLLRHMADRQISTMITGAESAEKACGQLIESVNRKGGIDNTTAVLARFPIPAKGLKDICDSESDDQTRETDTLDYLSGKNSPMSNVNDVAATIDYNVDPLAGS